MRYASLVLVLALACIVGSAVGGCASRRDNAAERQFIGTWTAQGQQNTYTWKLDADGSFGKSTGFVTPKKDDGTWRVDRGELILNVKNGKKTEQRTAAKVIGNTMTVDVPGEGTLIFTRQN